jgi:hypothetical protein
MVKTEDVRPGSSPSSPDQPMDSGAEMAEPSIMRIVEEYRAALQAGQKPDREAFLARCPQMAGALADCLDALEFIENAAPHLQKPSSEPRNRLLPVSEEFQPEGPLGDFRIVREIGRGGMGVVYEAVQISLGRRVALKVLPFASALDPRQLQRFKNEAQAAAHLYHTNIVPVHAVGCERGVHYYAMQFIEGQTLAQVIADFRLQICQKGQMLSIDSPRRHGILRPQFINLQSAICNRSNPRCRGAFHGAFDSERVVHSHGGQLGNSGG